MLGSLRFRKFFQILFGKAGFLLMGLLAIMAYAQVSAAKRIFIIGDSTVMTYAENKYPQMGWGQLLGLFFTAGGVTITNDAIGGRSSRSFHEEGRWKTTLGKMQKGDFLFIQFGHNDRSTVEERHADTTQFKSFLTIYVNESRAKGAIPILVSPMNMNAWNGTTIRTVFREGANNYRGAMMNVAKALDVPFIDLEQKSVDLFKVAGQSYCASFYFLGLDKGEYANFPDGSTDGTHFQEMGALEMAKAVAAGIKELSAHGDIGPLAASLIPMRDMVVGTNKAGAGLITKTSSYPSGANITVKVKPNSGQTFTHWTDGAGKVLTTKKTHTFAMADKSASVYAVFEGGTTALRRVAAKSARASIPGLAPLGTLGVSGADALGRKPFRHSLP